jgi:flavin reductase (DIM6/NTAB) family NADH-FMN oxidoreductase RutF
MSSDVASAAIESTTLRHALAQFPSGVTVVTAITEDGRPAGCTVSAFSSVSLDPPLVLLCIGRDRTMHDVLTSAERFAVNVLSANQAWLALRFARPGDRFDGLATNPGRGGIPLLDGATAYFECRTHQAVAAGDHTIVLGEVQQLATTGRDPLCYLRGGFRDLLPEERERCAPPAEEWLLPVQW